jgi:hypothetical protein
LYLVAFFLTPLSSAPQGAHPLLRRAHFWLLLLLGDESFAAWCEGASRDSLAQRAVLLTTTTAVLFVALAAGWLALLGLRVRAVLTRLEQFVFATGVGLSLVSLATLALGLCGLLQRPLFWGLGLAVALVAGAGWVRRSRIATVTAHDGAIDAAAGRAAFELPMSSGWLWLGFPFVLVILGSAMLPPVQFDVREYHLQAPKEFYQQGRITFLPHNVYANMPLGAEMLALAGMVVTGDWWSGALVGKLLVACYAPLTALALLACGRRFVSPAAGIIAAVVYISIPWVVLVSTQGLVDGVLACYLFLAFDAAWIWHQTAENLPLEPPLERTASSNAPLAALAGFLAGSAVSVKYPAAVYCIVPLSAFFACNVYRSHRSGAPSLVRALRPLVWFAAGGIAGCGPWLAKNWILTGNPTYPLLYRVFGGLSRTAALDAQWVRAHRPPNFAAEDLLQRLSGVLLTSDWLSPLLVSLAVLAFVNRRSRRLTTITTAYFAFIFGAWWLFTHRIDRFWVPALPLLALLAGIGGAWASPPWWRGTLAVLAAVGLSFNFAVIASGQLIDNRLMADLETLRNDSAHVEPWHRWLNDHADEVERVLLVADAQPFDLQVRADYNTVFDSNRLEQLARDRSPREVREALRQRGVSHVYVSWREIDRYRSPGNYGMTGFLQPRVFDDLVAAGVLEQVPPLADDSGRMYRVRPTP